MSIVETFMFLRAKTIKFYDYIKLCDMKNSRLVAQILFFILSVSLQAQTTYYVKSGSTGRGSSWSEASGSIQTMLDKAVSGDVIWVASGTYKTARFEGFLLKRGVNIYGGFNGTETSSSQREIIDTDSNGVIDAWEFKNQTIIDAQNHGRCITGNFYGYNSPYIIFDGFTVQNGKINDASLAGGGIDAQNDLTIQNCIVKNCSSVTCGGGIYCNNSSLEINNCKVINCSSGQGGGIASSGVVSNCDISYCTASSGGGICATRVFRCTVTNCSGGWGGGIYASTFTYSPYSSKYTYISGCTVTNCSGGFGGGIYSTFSVSHCKISNCNSSFAGGGICLSEYGYCANCLIENCFSLGEGGGINSSTSGTANLVAGVYNSNILNCSASTFGGGIYSNSTTEDAFLNNNIIVNCSANNDGGGIYCNNSYSHINNCAATNNFVGTVVSNFVFGSQSGNITPNLNSIFVKPTNFIGKANNSEDYTSLSAANWHLKMGSPCINAGTSYNLPKALLSGDDLDNNSRVLYGRIDMGAYEYADVLSAINSPFIDKYKYEIIDDLVVIKELTPNSVVRLFDIAGKIILSNNVDAESSTFRLPHKGIYIINVTSGNKIVNRKIIW